MSTRVIGRSIQVMIGQVHLTRPPHRLVTVLGSCVGLVVYDFTTRIAGMAHVLLPHGRTVVPEMPGRHAQGAVECLIQAMDEMGVPQQRLKAWMAGGANMFPSESSSAGTIKGIGTHNIEAITLLLAQHRIPVIERDIGGERGRRMHFDPARGCMSVDRLLPTTLPTAAVSGAPS